MATSLWDVVTGNSRKNASSEQMKREEARLAAERAKAEAEAKARAEAEAAKKRVSEITFKRGGAVTKKAPAKTVAKRPAVKPKARR